MKLKNILILIVTLNSLLLAQYNGGSGSGYASGSTTAVQLTAFLQGPYSGGTMNTTLNENDFIPLSQPYNSAPWNYTGTETVDTIPANVVDWVLVELRSNTPDSTTIQKRACFILNNGTIVDIDGTSPVNLYKSGGSDYYIVIRHRNHLAIMTATSLSLSSSLSGSYLTGINPIYNFSTAQTQAFGTNPMLDLGAGVFGFISGDANASGDFSPTDLAQVRIGVRDGETGYLNKDVNLSGDLSPADLLRVRQGLINGYTTLVP